MSQDLPDSFDPKQPDLPSLSVDPDPLPDSHDGEDTGTAPVDDDAAPTG